MTWILKANNAIWAIRTIFAIRTIAVRMRPVSVNNIVYTIAEKIKANNRTINIIVCCPFPYFLFITIQ
ncbi:hypothetical protein OY11_24115 [Salmonella enterica]|nr:hypothetical protein [Salmonella enterica]ELO80725.1 hypothetical protein SEEERB17_003977 [Salmonella enterica subsp. enterica serovar Enteritidis str. SARB17]